MATYAMSEISQRLAEDAAEVDNALGQFMAERMAQIEKQKRANDIFEAEMAEIEEKDAIRGVESANESKASVDHNMMRHLNITKRSSDTNNFEAFNQVRDEEEFNHRFEPGYVDEPIKAEFDKGLKPKPPMPNDEEKAAIREEIFSLLSESKAEEFALELQYEQLREEVGAYRSEHLAEGLFTVQKDNYVKLKHKLEEYQPQGFGKAWGNDPDYIAIMCELKESLEAADTAESGVRPKPKRKGKKKRGGH